MTSDETMINVNEVTPLVIKTARMSASGATHSQRTYETVSTSSNSYEQQEIHQHFHQTCPHSNKTGDEEEVNGEAPGPVLGSMVVFETHVPDEEAACCEDVGIIIGVPSSGHYHGQQEQGEPEVDASLLENVIEEVHQVTDVFLHELSEADQGERNYLEMGLIRNLSILPSDIMDAAISSKHQPPEKPLPTQDPDLEEATGTTTTPIWEDPIKDVVPSRPLSAYFLLFIAITSLSALGPLLQLQKNTTAAMKLQWRMIGTAVLLLPLVAKEIYHQGLPRLTTPQWISFLFCTVSYDVFSLCFVLALDYTSVGNAVILSNSLALILLVGKLCVGDRVTFLEGSGALIAFCGCVLCSKDSAGNSGGGAAALSGGGGLTGDALAILSALGGVGYLIFAKASRQHLPLYTFMFLNFFLGSLLILPFQIIVMGEQVTFDRQANHGLWGFFNLDPDRLPLEIIMVVVCNVLGNVGYVQTMQYFDNLVISSAALMEPVMAVFLAFAFGVGHLPGVAGWLGNAMVAGGTFAVVYAGGNNSGDKKI